MTTFALLHGAFHGAWCWDLVRPELESRGYRTVAIDLPCDDPEAGSARYAEVAAGRRVVRMVFLNAFIPIPGRAFSDQFGEDGIFPPAPESTWPITREDGLMTWPLERVVPVLYPDCPADLASWAPRPACACSRELRTARSAR